METLFGRDERGGTRTVKPNKKRELLRCVMIKAQYFGVFGLLSRFRFEGEAPAPLLLLSAGGSAEGAARGTLHCSRIRIRIRAIRAGQGGGQRLLPPSPAGHARGSAPQLLLSEARGSSAATGGRDAATPPPPHLPPRIASHAAGSRPRTGSSRQPAASPPGSARGRGSRRPRPGVTKWRLLFVCRRRCFQPPCQAPRPWLPPPAPPSGVKILTGAQREGARRELALNSADSTLSETPAPLFLTGQNGGQQSPRPTLYRASPLPRDARRQRIRGRYRAD